MICEAPPVPKRSDWGAPQLTPAVQRRDRFNRPGRDLLGQIRPDSVHAPPLGETPSRGQSRGGEQHGASDHPIRSGGIQHRQQVSSWCRLR